MYMAQRHLKMMQGGIECIRAGKKERGGLEYGVEECIPFMSETEEGRYFQKMGSSYMYV